MKVLVLGDSDGHFRVTFEKAALLAKKQNFDCLLCLGNLFNETTSESDISDILGDKITVSIPTYFTCGSDGLPAAIKAQTSDSPGRICKNLFLLGRSGRVILSNETVLECLNGDHQRNTTALEQHSPHEVDVLVTATSPRNSDHCLHAVLSAIPRYHFFSSDRFLEIPPYQTLAPDGKIRITREIALAPIGNSEKSRWFYAFNLESIAQTDMSNQRSCSQNPYSTKDASVLKRKLEGDIDTAQRQSTESELRTNKRTATNLKQPPTGYVCKICSASEDHYFRDCPEKSSARKRMPVHRERMSQAVDPDSCFFCLSNSKLARHLIVSIGDAGSYVVLPKGGMTQNHVIILPIDHKATMKSLGDGRGSVESEIERYIASVQEFYNSFGTTGIVFDISRSSGVHYHIQMLPVPVDKCDDLIDAFHALAENEGIVLSETDVAADEEDFFRVRLPGDGRILTGLLNTKKRFDLQFGRRVISEVMGVPERAHWKDCLRTVEQETSDANFFKASFKTFDFTQE